MGHFDDTMDYGHLYVLINLISEAVLSHPTCKCEEYYPDRDNNGTTYATVLFGSYLVNLAMMTKQILKLIMIMRGNCLHRMYFFNTSTTIITIHNIFTLKKAHTMVIVLNLMNLYHN